VSHIAAALAKSKGKDVPSPAAAASSPLDGTKAVSSLRIGPSSKPVLSPAPPKLTPLPIVKPIAPTASLPPAAALPPTPVPTTAPKSSVVVAVVTVIVLIAAVFAWMLLKKDNTFAAPFAAASGTPAAGASPNAASKPAAAPLAKLPAALVAAEPASPASLALAEKVRLLPITGAAGGGSQRLSVSGKVFEPGDTVVEGLILQSIEAEEIVFRDSAGNLYTRRL
jgi:hypothetical protein